MKSFRNMKGTCEFSYHIYGDITILGFITRLSYSVFSEITDQRVQNLCKDIMKIICVHKSTPHIKMILFELFS